MFNIQFSPVRCDNTDLLTVYVNGDVINLNGVDFDFGPLQDGDILPAEAVGSDYVVGDVIRSGNNINITLMMPYRANAPDYVTFPVSASVAEGGVNVPTSTLEVNKDD